MTRELARQVIASTHPETDAGGGERETWFTGTGPGVTFRLDSGAGGASTHLSLLVEFADGSRVWEYVDMTTFLDEWVTLITSEREHGARPGRPD